GQTCQHGGILIQSGVDADNNGVLEGDEIETSLNVCSVAGTDGENGADGLNGAVGAEGAEGSPGAQGEKPPRLLSQVSSADLALCPAGGSVVSFGADINDNGVLDPGEIENLTTVCAGVAGTDACAPVVRVTPVEPGVECQAGGVRIAY